MKLVLMSTPNFFVEEHHILTALFDEGLEMVHLDKPNSEPVFCERLLSLLPESYRRLIVTHDHFYLQNEYELKGIHLSERNPQVPAGYKGCVSCSCDSLDSLSQAKKDRDHVLFDVTDIDLSTLKDASKRKLIDKKVFATGDIDLDNVSQIADCGFGGVVLQEAIWKRFDIHNTQDFKEIINYFRKVRRAVD
jgi:thiamine-phosphate pyrophosphorylase